MNWERISSINRTNSTFVTDNIKASDVCYSREPYGSCHYGVCMADHILL